MAFGLFKKLVFADTIYQNGNIYTQNPALPWAEAIAVVGDRIEKVGSSDDMDDLLGPDTRVVDLGGKFVYPGFIDCHRSHTMNLFSGKYLDLSHATSIEEIVNQVSFYADDYEDREVIFGYGYDEHLLDDADDDWENPLDTIQTDKPIVLLAKSTIAIWTNQVAKDIANETAEEEMVDIITPNYVLNLLLPFDFDDLEDGFSQITSDLADKGFTTILDLQAPSYLQQFFKDAAVAKYNEGELKQRIFFTQYVNTPLTIESLLYLMDKQKTLCTELGAMIHADMLNLLLDNENAHIPFPEEHLFDTLMRVADKGYTFFVEAINKSDLELAYKGLDYIRSRGYKNDFIIASDCSLDDDFRKELLYNEDSFGTWGTDIFNEVSIYGEVDSMEEKIDELTTVAAEYIGMSEVLGSLEKGKFADFCVFDTDILKLLKKDKLPQCEMTVLNGQIVHDLDSEADMEFYDMMQKQQF